MIAINMLAPTPSPIDWETLLRERAELLGLNSIDVVVDQANIGTSWQRKLHAVAPPIALLNNTPHADAASEGPVLVRLSIGPLSASRGLRQLIKHFSGQPRLLVLLNDWPYDQLAEHLRYYLQPEWDGGKSKGVLRFYNTGLFRIVISTLDESIRQHLLAGASEWHWIDRDGNAMAISSKYRTSNKALPPLCSEPLQLEPKHIDVLSAWHQAELWSQDELLTPSQCGVHSKEAMLEKLAAVQMAADAQKLWSQPERHAFLEAQIFFN
ncbi:DUF4123 domain-containing protein [Crenobacter sp. SG2305]|uniref:DUF4123 domain-containing protein n=1 Tax=Crenobacter oryzisoli TaxID=3056844 RepID=UPI0025AB1F2E|nr:DUF4123 domain-containing protein [Crenobacter sp. SG2305]MDN0085762.1 DUF4123 domain-containing protein [Crenobacter sp. SG2305]